ncbi:hypothetical protein ALC62_00602 [Cyphomyrmex costatus]|uniref:Uncharacterized protein n=1 Tax=Cyphomyrmex costatus TaxID=456900 RepID=A0A151IQH9_9HYME|nr:hypothetical protein ALC62_00602 [Cyphomyrmex costatus]
MNALASFIAYVPVAFVQKILTSLNSILPDDAIGYLDEIIGRGCSHSDSRQWYPSPAWLSQSRPSHSLDRISPIGLSPHFLIERRYCSKQGERKHMGSPEQGELQEALIPAVVIKLPFRIAMWLPEQKIVTHSRVRSRKVVDVAFHRSDDVNPNDTWDLRSLGSPKFFARRSWKRHPLEATSPIVFSRRAAAAAVAAATCTSRGRAVVGVLLPRSLHPGHRSIIDGTKIFPVDNEQGQFPRKRRRVYSADGTKQDDDYRKEVGQCAYANTFNRVFRGRSCRPASSCISVKNSFSPASSL